MRWLAQALLRTMARKIEVVFIEGVPGEVVSNVTRAFDRHCPLTAAPSIGDAPPRAQEGHHSRDGATTRSDRASAARNPHRRTHGRSQADPEGPSGWNVDEDNG